MGELLSFSQTSSLLLPQFKLHTSKLGQLRIGQIRSSLSVTSAPCMTSTRLAIFPTSYAEKKLHSWMARASVISDSKVPTPFTVDSAGEGFDILPDSGGSDNNLGGGGGGGGGGDNDKGEEGSDGSEDWSGGGEKKGMSMSQKHWAMLPWSGLED